MIWLVFGVVMFIFYGLIRFNYWVNDDYSETSDLIFSLLLGFAVFVLAFLLPFAEITME